MGLGEDGVILEYKLKWVKTRCKSSSISGEIVKIALILFIFKHKIGLK